MNYLLRVYFEKITDYMKGDVINATLSHNSQFLYKYVFVKLTLTHIYKVLDVCEEHSKLWDEFFFNYTNEIRENNVILHI